MNIVAFKFAYYNCASFRAPRNENDIAKEAQLSKVEIYDSRQEDLAGYLIMEMKRSSCEASSLTSLGHCMDSCAGGNDATSNDTEMKSKIINIKLIDWALIMCWLLNALLWAGYPQFTLRTGAFYINMGIIYTLLFVKVKSLSKGECADNFTNLKKQLPLLIYMLAMGILLHRFLETVYWEPERQKMIQRLEENDRMKDMFDKNGK